MLRFIKQKNKADQKDCPEKRKHRRGFTLLVALMVNAIIIVIGLSISSILFRQFNLSVLTRESQVSFYAIDTITECMRYWDKKRYAFSDNAATLYDVGLLYCDEYRDSLGAPKIDYLVMTKVEGSVCTVGLDNNYYQDVYTNTDPGQIFVLKSSPGSKHPSATFTFERRRHTGCTQLDPLQMDAVDPIFDGNGYNSEIVTDPRRIERGLSATW